MNTNDFFTKLINEIKKNTFFFRKYNFILDFIILFIIMRLNFLLFHYQSPTDILNTISKKENSKRIKIFQNCSRFLLQMVSLYDNEIEGKNKSSKIVFYSILIIFIEIKSRIFNGENNLIEFIKEFDLNFLNSDCSQYVNTYNNLFSYFSKLIIYMNSDLLIKDYFESMKIFQNHISASKFENSKQYDCFEHFNDLFKISNFLFLYKNEFSFQPIFEKILPLVEFKKNNDFTIFFILTENITKFYETFPKYLSLFGQGNSNSKILNITLENKYYTYLIVREINISKASVFINIFNFLKEANFRNIFNENFYKNFALINRVEIEEKFIRLLLKLNQKYIDLLNSDFLQLSNLDYKNYGIERKLIFNYLEDILNKNEDPDYILNLYLKGKLKNDLLSLLINNEKDLLNPRIILNLEFGQLIKLKKKIKNNKNVEFMAISILDFFFNLMMSNFLKINLYLLIDYLKNNQLKKIICPFEKDDEINFRSYYENVNTFIQNNLNELLLLAKKYKIIFTNENPIFDLFLIKSYTEKFYKSIFDIYINNSLNRKIIKNNHSSKNFITPCKKDIINNMTKNENDKVCDSNSLSRKEDENERKITSLNLVGKVYNFYNLVNSEKQKRFYSNFILGYYASDKLIINETFYIKVNHLKEQIDSLIKKIDSEKFFENNNLEVDLLFQAFQEEILSPFLKISKGIEELEMIMSKTTFLNRNNDIENFLNLSNYFLTYVINFLYELRIILKNLTSYFNKNYFFYFESKFSFSEQISNMQYEYFVEIISKNYEEFLKAYLECIGLLKRVSKQCLNNFGFKFKNKIKNNNKYKNINTKDFQNENNYENFNDIKHILNPKLKKIYSIYTFLKVFKLNNKKTISNKPKYLSIYNDFKITEQNKQKFINDFCEFYDENQNEDEHLFKKRLLIILNTFMFFEKKMIFETQPLDFKKEDIFDKDDENLNFKNLKILFLIISKFDIIIYIQLVNHFLENLINILNKNKKGIYFLSEIKLNLINDIIFNFFKILFEKNPIYISNTENQQVTLLDLEINKMFKNFELYYFYVFENLNTLFFSNKSFELINFAKFMYSRYYNNDSNCETQLNLNFFINFYFIQIINIAKICFLLDRHVNFYQSNKPQFYISATLQLLHSITTNLCENKLRNSVLLLIWEKQILSKCEVLKNHNEKEFNIYQNIVFYFIFPFIKSELNVDIFFSSKFILSNFNEFFNRKNYTKLADVYFVNKFQENKLEYEDKMDIIEDENLSENLINKDHDINQSTIFLEKSLQLFENFITYGKHYLKFFDYMNDLSKNEKQIELSVIENDSMRSEITIKMDLIENPPTFENNYLLNQKNLKKFKIKDSLTDKYIREPENLNKNEIISVDLNSSIYGIYNNCKAEKMQSNIGFGLEGERLFEDKNNYLSLNNYFTKIYLSIKDVKNKYLMIISCSENRNLYSKTEFINKLISLKNILNDNFQYNIFPYNYLYSIEIEDNIRKNFKQNDLNDMIFLKEFHNIFCYFDNFEFSNFKQFFCKSLFDNIDIKSCKNGLFCKITKKFECFKKIILLIKYVILFNQEEFDIIKLISNFELNRDNEIKLNKTIFLNELREIFHYFKDHLQDFDIFEEILKSEMENFQTPNKENVIEKITKILNKEVLLKL